MIYFSLFFNLNTKEANGEGICGEEAKRKVILQKGNIVCAHVCASLSQYTIYHGSG